MWLLDIHTCISSKWTSILVCPSRAFAVVSEAKVLFDEDYVWLNQFWADVTGFWATRAWHVTSLLNFDSLSEQKNVCMKLTFLRQTDRQTDRLTDRQRDRQTKIDRDRQTDRQIDRQKQTEIDRQIDRDRQRQRQRLTDGNRPIHRQTDRHR